MCWSTDRWPPGLRAWTLASGLLARLAKEGIDPLRDSGVREALKRLILDCFEGLAKQLFKPVVVSTAAVVLLVSGILTHLGPWHSLIYVDAIDHP